MRMLLDWLDARTDYRQVLAPIRRRVLPNGPRWSYTTASCLLWLFVLQIVTGLLLMLSYSPSTTTAWASVHFIEQSASGRFLRGIHHFTSHALIILAGIHIVRVMLVRAFRAPRELLWITGILMVPLLLVWSISGNPLTGGMRGMAQIEVEGNIIGSTPIVGPIIQTILIGGEEVGHLTLTHLYFLHVGLLPLLVIGLLVFHIGQVYRHGLTSTEAVGGPRLPYWPYQSVRNATMLSVLLGVIGVLAWRLGAPLDAPADPTLPLTPRPEWYFRSLFELRRYFQGDWEFVATVVIPGLVLGFFVFYPVLDSKCSPRWSAVLRTLVVLVGFGSWGGLTLTSYWRDWQDQEYLASVQHTEELSARARVLADRSPLPPEGAIVLLEEDPKTQGPLLFARHCSACHSHTDAQGRGIAAAEPSAPNLFGVGRANWIMGFLDPDQIANERYFGKTKFAEGDMVSKVKELFDGTDEETAKKTKADLQLVADVLAAEADLPHSADPTDEQTTKLAHGRELLAGTLGCTDCHKFHDKGELGSAPDLTGYASRSWLRDIVSNPQHERFYAADRNDRMPAFAENEQHPENNLLSERDLNLIVDWLREDWYEPNSNSSLSSPSLPPTKSLASTVPKP